MSRRRHNSTELELIDKLKYENQQLRKKISILRKQLSRVDIERVSELEDELEERIEEEAVAYANDRKKKKEEDSIKKKWWCKKCNKDYLRLRIYNRLDGLWYNRACPTCKHKTKLQRYTDKVEGPKE